MRFKRIESSFLSLANRSALISDFSVLLLLLLLLISAFLPLASSAACRDRLDDCNDSRAFCRRDGYENFMRSNCRRTCNFCSRATATTRKPRKKKKRKNGACRDLGSNCRRNRDWCDRSPYSKLMQEQCLRTCGFCKYDGFRVTKRPRHRAGCVDRNAACINWEQHGFCSSRFYSRAVKEEECARSCRFC